MVCAAYTFHMNIPPLYGELKNPTTGRMMTATVLSVAIGAAMYISVGVCVYVAFGKSVVMSAAAGGNYLRHFSDTHGWANAARGMIVFHIICAFPIFAIVARRSWYIMMTGNEQEESLWKRVVMGVTLVVFAVCITLVIPGLGVLMAFTGALFGTSIEFILPALFYYRLHGSKPLENRHAEETTEEKAGEVAIPCEPVKKTSLVQVAVGSRGMRYAAIAVALFGVVDMGASLAVVIKDLC